MSCIQSNHLPSGFRDGHFEVCEQLEGREVYLLKIQSKKNQACWIRQRTAHDLIDDEEASSLELYIKLAQTNKLRSHGTDSK